MSGYHKMLCNSSPTKRSRKPGRFEIFFWCSAKTFGNVPWKLIFNLEAPRHARWTRGYAASSATLQWSVQRFTGFWNFTASKPPGIRNRLKDMGICLNHYNPYVGRLSSENNPFDKNKSPLLGGFWGEKQITTAHTPIAFLRQRRIPSIRVGQTTI